jgi:hypothetical protein
MAQRLVSVWGKCATRNLPEYWPFILSIQLVVVDCSQIQTLVLHCLLSTIHIEVDTRFELVTGCQVQSAFGGQALEVWLKEYVHKNAKLALQIFVENLCLELFEKYKNAIEVNDLDQKAWSSGCDLMLFLLCSNAKYAGIHANLKPLPEIARFEGKNSALREYDAVAKLLDDIGRGEIPIDEIPQSLRVWIKLFSEFVLGIRSVSNDTEAVDDADFVFSIDLLPDPEFEALCAKHGKFEAYHGSPTENWYSIIRNGLQNRSWTKEMKSGAIFGSGIYLSTDLSLSRMFTKLNSGWKGCPLGTALEIVGVYEIIDDPSKVSFQRSIEQLEQKSSQMPEKYVLVEDSNTIRLKSILVWTKKKSKFSKSCKIFCISASIFLLLWIVFWTLNQSLHFRRYYRRLNAFVLT